MLFLMYIIIGTLLILFALSFLLSQKKLDIEGGHVLVTGGSSGIGKAIAIEAAKRGANVTLLARNQTKLGEAKALVEQSLKDRTKQRVLHISVDLCNEYASVEKAVNQAEEKLGPVTMLVNCAGWSISGRFEDTSIDDFKAVIRSMKERGQGRIVLLSSQAGQIGLFGYSAYSASKYALRGLAESLQMELKPYNVRVTLAFPPDTNTPGYEEENKYKPKETQLISETAGLFQPDYVARCIMNDGLAGKFLSYIGTDGWMLAQITAGMSPATNALDILAQIFLTGILRVVGLFYLAHFDSTVKKCKLEREKHNKDL